MDTNEHEKIVIANDSEAIRRSRCEER